ncbi:hypothetical protein AwMethylo_03770 [Methylobacterium sp.]|nr:hypothetical protein AwMethylo_03770 [Methylobacterium sp.]
MLASESWVPAPALPARFVRTRRRGANLSGEPASTRDGFGRNCRVQSARAGGDAPRRPARDGAAPAAVEDA